MSFDFIHTKLTDAILQNVTYSNAPLVSGSQIVPSQIAAFSNPTGYYTGISATIGLVAVSSSLVAVTSSLGKGTQLFFVNGLLVSSSA